MKKIIIINENPVNVSKKLGSLLLLNMFPKRNEIERIITVINNIIIVDLIG